MSYSEKAMWLSFHESCLRRTCLGAVSACLLGAGAYSGQAEASLWWYSNSYQLQSRITDNDYREQGEKKTGGYLAAIVASTVEYQTERQRFMIRPQLSENRYYRIETVDETFASVNFRYQYAAEFNEFSLEAGYKEDAVLDTEFEDLGGLELVGLGRTTRFYKPTITHVVNEFWSLSASYEQRRVEYDGRRFAGYNDYELESWEAGLRWRASQQSQWSLTFFDEQQVTDDVFIVIPNPFNLLQLLSLRTDLEASTRGATLAWGWQPQQQLATNLYYGYYSADSVTALGDGFDVPNSDGDGELYGASLSWKQSETLSYGLQVRHSVDPSSRGYFVERLSYGASAAWRLSARSSLNLSVQQLDTDLRDDQLKVNGEDPFADYLEGNLTYSYRIKPWLRFTARLRSRDIQYETDTDEQDNNSLLIGIEMEPGNNRLWP